MLKKSSPMKAKLCSLARCSLLLALPMIALALGGCQTNPKGVSPFDPPSDEPPGGGTPRLHIGDTVSITFSGMPTEDTAFAPLEKPIKDDGTITLPDIGRVQAAGKTPGDLEDAIHDLYVPKHVKHLNVTVKTSNERVYYVSGEVKGAGRVLYTGPTTVTKAITAAGDFTDFADKADVTLIRGNNRFFLNVKKILNGDAKDPPVYPGDQITVGRRIL